MKPKEVIKKTIAKEEGYTAVPFPFTMVTKQSVGLMDDRLPHIVVTNRLIIGHSYAYDPNLTGVSEFHEQLSRKAILQELYGYVNDMAHQIRRSLLMGDIETAAKLTDELEDETNWRNL